MRACLSLRTDIYPNVRRGFTYHWLPSPAFCTGSLLCSAQTGSGVFLAISQTNPANSRAIAAITRGCDFPARLRWRYRLHRRVCAFQPISVLPRIERAMIIALSYKWRSNYSRMCASSHSSLPAPSQCGQSPAQIELPEQPDGQSVPMTKSRMISGPPE